MLTSNDDSSRFSDYNPTNHQAPLWITTSLSLMYSCSLLFVRILVKLKFWGLDDLVLALAYVSELRRVIVIWRRC